MLPIVDVNDSKKLNQSVQFTYLKEKNEFGKYGDEFFIASLYKVNVDSLENTFSNSKNNIELLNGKYKMLHNKLSDNCPIQLVYSYYVYDEKNEKISLISSASNNILVLKDGILYNFAYRIGHMTQEKEVLVKKLVEKFVLGCK